MFFRLLSSLILLSLINSFALAETSGVDPFTTVQDFLSEPSSTTRESVIEMTRSMFTKPYSTYSPEIYAPSSNAEDLSISYLEQIFGTVPGVLSGSTTTLLSQMFYVFNLGVFAVVGFILSIVVINNTVNTGAQGQFMGRRNQNPYWIWFRSFTGVSILMPSYNGYSLIQVMIMWVAVQGIGLSNAIWAEVQNIVYNTNSILSYVKLVDSDVNTNAAGISPSVEATQKAYDRCAYIDTQACTAGSAFISNSSVDNALNMTQMLLIYQSCLSYNLKQWEADYQACMKVAGNYDNISCYPPKKENLYQINYSNYSISYVGPSSSKTTFGCGNIQMTPTCTNKSTCEDYQADYDKKVFDALITFFNKADEPANQIFQYYDGCNEEDENQSCYRPPNEEYSGNCIESDGSINSNCYITEASLNAMDDFTNKVIAYQMEYADNSEITAMDAGEAQTGYADALGFMDGGWILAGNSYSTMVFYGAKVDDMSLPMMNPFTATLAKSSLPDSLKLVYNYLTPYTGSVIDSATSSSSANYLSSNLTLQQSLFDWSNPISADEIAQAQQQTDDVQTSSDDDTVITAAPISQCLTGDYYYKDGKAIACNEVLGGEPPSSEAPSVDALDCGKNDFSIRYLSCLVYYNLSGRDIRGGDEDGKSHYNRFLFNASVEDDNSNNNWMNFLSPTYDIGMPTLFGGDAPDWQKISTDYFKGIHQAWVIGMFGGNDVRDIIDPVYRMRQMGIQLIDYSTEYVKSVVGDALDYVQQVVWEFYFGYAMVQLTTFMYLNFFAVMLGNAQAYIDMAFLDLYIFLAETPFAFLIPVFKAINIFINVIFSTIYFIFNTVGVLADIVAQLIPMLAQIIILSGTQFFTLYLAIAIPILILGGYLAGYLSMLPYLVYLVTVAGWFLLILESIIAAPLIALGVTYPQGHDFFGRAEQLLSMILSIFLRPACILIGFIFGILMASMSLFLLNAILFPVLINYMGLIIGSDFLSITLTNYIQGISSASPFKSYSGGITDTFIYFSLMLLYAYAASSVLIYSFSLTYMIPYQLTRWVDPRAAESPEEVRGSMDEIKQSFVAEVIGGMANALTSLFTLTSLFAQTAQFAPSGSGRVQINSQQKLEEIARSKNASVGKK